MICSHATMGNRDAHAMMLFSCGNERTWGHVDVPVYSFSGNSPGIQRGASRAGNAKESGARGLVEIKTSWPTIRDSGDTILKYRVPTVELSGGE